MATISTRAFVLLLLLSCGKCKGEACGEEIDPRLILGDALLASWTEISCIHIEWALDEKSYGSLVVPDPYELEDAFVLPHAGGEPDFLAELHLIQCLDALHWNALRTTGDRLEV